MNYNILYSIGILLSSSLEMYNYMLFPFIQGIIIPDFYNGTGNIGFLILFLAALFRPIGSWIFGYIGDMYGRKQSILLSMSLMSFSCMFILVFPRYQTLGNYAVIGLILGRIMQVISMSGEHAGVAISLIETLDGTTDGRFQKYGLASGLAYFFAMFGSFLATIAVYYFHEKNWQYAYILSFVLIIFCFILRFLPYSEKTIVQEDICQKDQNFFTNFIACLLISATMSSLYYFNTVFMPFYFAKYGFLTYKNFTMIYLLIYMFSTFFCGWISDFFERLYMFILIPSFIMFFTLFFTLYFCNPYLHCVNVFLLAMYAGPSHAIFFKLFSRKYRYRGISIAYSLGTALIGSSTPLIASYLVFNIYFVMIYLFFLFGLSISGIFLSYKTLKNKI